MACQLLQFEIVIGVDKGGAILKRMIPSEVEQKLLVPLLLG